MRFSEKHFAVAELTNMGDAEPFDAWGLKLRTTRRAELSQMRTLRVYAGKRFVIHAVQADWSRATTAAAVSP